MEDRPDLRTLGALLMHQALVGLGELPDPVSNATSPNLEQARFAIALLELVEERTRAARSQDEERFLLEVLTQLRLAYVRARDAQTATPPSPSEGSVT